MNNEAALGAVRNLSGPTPARRWNGERLFFSGVAIAAATTVLLGFAPTYFLKPFNEAPALSLQVHVHAALYSTWILLLVVQTNLVATGRISAHRWLGAAGGALVVAMLVTGYFVAIDFGRRATVVSTELVPGSLQFLIVPLGGLVVFAALVGGGLALRRRADFHKRLMLLGTVELLNAAVDRLPGVGASGLAPFYLGTDMFLLALVAYDLVALRRLHPATLWGGLFLVGMQWLRVTFANTAAWIAVATWLTR